MTRVRLTLDIGGYATATQLARAADDVARSLDVCSDWLAVDQSLTIRRTLEERYTHEPPGSRSILSERDRDVLEAYRHLRNLWRRYDDTPPEIWMEEVWRWSRRYPSGKGGAVADPPGSISQYD